MWIIADQNFKLTGTALRLLVDNASVCHRCVSWNRQINIKGRTATWFTGCLDEARMFSDDPVNYCEAEAAPSARFLGGEIGFKDAAPDLCFHSNASICDADAYIIFCFGLD